MVANKTYLPKTIMQTNSEVICCMCDSYSRRKEKLSLYLISPCLSLRCLYLLGSGWQKNHTDFSSTLPQSPSNYSEGQKTTVTGRMVGTVATEERLSTFLDDEKEVEGKEKEGGSHSRNCKRRGLQTTQKPVFPSDSQRGRTRNIRKSSSQNCS